jgi:hypothetical protein
VDEEVADELLTISLKNFEDLRKLATEAGLKNDYVVYYQPDSIVVHGHWPALRSYYLEMCREPLHRLHLQPSFRLPGLNPELLDRAFDLFLHAYDIWIRRYSLEDQINPLVSQYFSDCERTLANSGKSPQAASDGS